MKSCETILSNLVHLRKQTSTNCCAGFLVFPMGWPWSLRFCSEVLENATVQSEARRRGVDPCEVRRTQILRNRCVVQHPRQDCLCCSLRQQCPSDCWGRKRREGRLGGASGAAHQHGLNVSSGVSRRAPDERSEATAEQRFSRDSNNISRA